MRDYGVEIYRYGAVFHGDGRKRLRGKKGLQELMPPMQRQCGPRGKVRALSRGSQRRLEFIAANVAIGFTSLLTVTYHANVETWETDAERNGRIARRAKSDLHRFLRCLRKELEEYLWVMEFQLRGVIHFHVLCTGAPVPERVAVAWTRATNSLDDAQAVRHATKTEAVNSERGARSYVGRYLGKARQKKLPPGVEAAGRWWGRSRGLNLLLLEEVVAGEAGLSFPMIEGVRVVRCLRKYVGKVFRCKFRGGMIVDWGGRLSEQLSRLTVTLRGYYGTSARVADLMAGRGWGEVEEVES